MTKEYSQWSILNLILLSLASSQGLVSAIWSYHSHRTIDTRLSRRSRLFCFILWRNVYSPDTEASSPGSTMSSIAREIGSNVMLSLLGERSYSDVKLDTWTFSFLSSRVSLACQDKRRRKGKWFLLGQSSSLSWTSENFFRGLDPPIVSERILESATHRKSWFWRVL